MKNVIVASIAAATAAFICAAPASAQTVSAPQFYGNLGYTFVDADAGLNYGVATARLGARLHPNFGLEAEAGLGVDGDTLVVAGTTVRTKVKHSFGGYAVAFLPVTPQLDLFARGGYGATRIRAESATASASDSENSWNYGVGGQYMFDALNGLRAEFTRHDFDNNGGSADAWGVSYVRKF
jgi:hypothetical protein